MPPSVSVGSPLPPGTVGKSNQPSLSSLRPCLVGGERALRSHRTMLMASIIAALPSPKKPTACWILEAEEAGLERLQVDQLLEQLAGLQEGLALEAAVLALSAASKPALPPSAHREMRPVEVQRPLVGAADGRSA